MNWALLMKLVEVVKAGLPLPSFTDEAAVTAWLAKMNPAEAEFIVAVVTQFKASGVVELELPNGEKITVAKSCDCCGVTCCLTEADAAKVYAAAPEAFGDGKWLEILQGIVALIPAIVALFSLFAALDPAPAPTPNPPINA